MLPRPKRKLNARSLAKRDESELTQKEYKYLFRKQKERTDAAFSKYIRARDGACVLCGSVEALQCSHVFTKNAHGSVRWDEMNAHAMCAACHTKHHRSDPGAYIEWMIERYGDAYFELRRRANEYRKWSIEEMKALEAKFLEAYDA